MRRRKPQVVNALPADLATFDVEGWLPFVEQPQRPDFPGTVVQWQRSEAFRLWCQARRTWSQEHGWPTGIVGLLREHVVLRKRLAGSSEPGLAADEPEEAVPGCRMPSRADLYARGLSGAVNVTLPSASVRSDRSEGERGVSFRAPVTSPAVPSRGAVLQSDAGRLRLDLTHNTNRRNNR